MLKTPCVFNKDPIYLNSTIFQMGSERTWRTWYFSVHQFWIRIWIFHWPHVGLGSLLKPDRTMFTCTDVSTSIRVWNCERKQNLNNLRISCPHLMHAPMRNTFHHARQPWELRFGGDTSRHFTHTAQTSPNALRYTAIFQTQWPLQQTLCNSRLQNCI